VIRASRSSWRFSSSGSLDRTGDGASSTGGATLRLELADALRAVLSMVYVTTSCSARAFCLGRVPLCKSYIGTEDLAGVVGYADATAPVLSSSLIN